MENGKNEGGKWEGMERAGWIHTHTPSSKSQKSAAGEGAGRPSGGGGWTELGVASRGFRSVRLSCSRPAGAVPAHPPPGYGLPAQFLSLRSCSVVSTTDTANAAPLSKPKPVVDILRGEGSSKQTSCCLSIGTLIGIWLPQSQYHYDIIKYLFGCVNTVWTLLQCFFFFFFCHMMPVCKTKIPHTHLCHSIPYSSGPYHIRICRKYSHDAPLHQSPAGVSVKHSLHKFTALLHYITHLGSSVVKYVTTN